MKQAVQHIPGEVQGKKKTRPECGSAFSVWVEAAFSKLRAAMTGRGKKKQKTAAVAQHPERNRGLL